MKKPFSIEKLSSALLAIEPQITKQQKQMLMTHYANRVASMQRIARFAGYRTYHSANSQYGGLAGKVAEQLGYISPGDKTYTIAETQGRDKRDHLQWQLDDEVAQALEQIGWVSPSEDVPIADESPTDFGDVTETERRALMKARRGQGVFRSEVVALWQSCAVTGCSLLRILAASHIVPWKTANNAERLDLFNGLLLTPNLHRLFDEFLISFNDDRSMLVSKSLDGEMRKAFGISARYKLRLVKREMLPYLRRHRKLFLERG
jgi:hypothetical protein